MYVFLHRHNHVLLLLLADPLHHLACGVQSKDKAIKLLMAFGNDSFCVTIPSFPVNRDVLCLPICCFPYCFHCLPSPTTVPISPLSALVINHLGYWHFEHGWEQGQRWWVAGRCSWLPDPFLSIQRQFLVWLELTNLLKWCQRLLLRLLLPSGFPAFMKIARILPGCCASDLPWKWGTNRLCSSTVLILHADELELSWT